MIKILNKPIHKHKFISYTYDTTTVSEKEGQIKIIYNIITNCL